MRRVVAGLSVPRDCAFGGEGTKGAMNAYNLLNLYIPFRSDPSRFLFLGAAGHVIRIFQDMNVTPPEYLSG